jgi:hypothetical protein
MLAKTKEKPRLFDDPALAKEAATLRRIQAERDALRQEYSDIHHARSRRRQKAEADGMTPEVAAELGDEPTVHVDDSVQRMTAIQRKLEAIEMADRIQTDRVLVERQRAERELRATVKKDHQRLARKKLELMKQARALYFEILEFERDRLSDLGFGFPLKPITNHIDNFAFSPVDSSEELDNSTRHEQELAAYIAEDA